MMSAKHESHNDQLVKHIPIGVYRFRTTPQEQMSFEYVNRQFCGLLGISSDDVYRDAKYVFDAIHPDELDAFMKLNREAMQIRQHFIWEGQILVDKTIKWVRITANPEPIDNGDTIWNGAMIDITDRKKAEKALRDINSVLEKRLVEIEKLQEQLREQAIRDYLTGLFNRRYLDETMEREIAQATRSARRMSVVLMDIDHFKGINDTYGHQAGDIVLIELGQLLEKLSRASDIACRHGGDEFVVVMPTASPEQAFARSEEWRVAFAHKRFHYDGRKFKTTLSMGIATYPLHASSFKGVFQAADQALYQSKINNNKVTISRRISTSTLRSIGESSS